jgi:hypothetical protein
MRIADAAREALCSLNRSATPNDIYSEIQKKKLYQFGASNPVSVLNSAIRRHTLGSKTLQSTPLFEKLPSGKYQVIRQSGD